MRDLWCTSFSKVQVTILACQQTSCEGKSCKLLRAFVSGNTILSYFTISKSYFINYTIPFYNTSNIPTFIFPILLVKIIYLPNKIIYPKTQIKKKKTQNPNHLCNHLLPPPPPPLTSTYPNWFLSPKLSTQTYFYQLKTKVIIKHKKKKKKKNHDNPQNQNKKQTKPRQPPTPATTATHKIKPNPPLPLRTCMP